MARGGVGGLCLAGRRSVAEAVIGRAQVRPALDHKAGKLVATPRSAGRRGSRVLRTAARLWFLGGMGGREGVRRPLPDVSRHIVEAVPVGREVVDGRSAAVAVEKQVLPG